MLGRDRPVIDPFGMACKVTSIFAEHADQLTLRPFRDVANGMDSQISQSCERFWANAPEYVRR